MFQPRITTHHSLLTPNSVSRFFPLLLNPKQPPRTPNNTTNKHHIHLYTNNLP